MHTNYSLFAAASPYYNGAGWRPVEVPWLVTEAVSNITKPPGAANYTVRKETKEGSKVFIASGEQGFLYQIAKGQLPRHGKFQTITPCIRDDPFDEMHVKYFMKLELITYWPRDDEGLVDKELDFMLHRAQGFFEGHVPGGRGVEVVRTEQGFDINVNGVEVGSYGIRRCDLCTWVYGTGLAEPRFSRARARHGNA